jgi:hypothetical protein
MYFYSNKGRAEKEGELERNNEIRNWVKEIDWECDLHTFFRDECVDIYTSLKGALDWVFSSEPEAIVLEDDCVPTPCFFSFCDQMIERYRDNNKVWCISGDNYMDYVPKDADYFFSHYHFMYGWASWRSRWLQLRWGNLPIQELIDSNILYTLYKTREQAKFRKKELIRVKDFVYRTNCWDYALGIEMDYNHAVTIHPKEHLVTCVGLFGEHSKISAKTMFHKRSICTESFYKIERHPEYVAADLQYDYLFFKKFRSYMRLYRRIYRRAITVLQQFFY